MSSRKEQREKAREERERREAEEKAKAQRKRRLLIGGGAAVAIIAIAVIVFAVSSGGDKKRGSAEGDAIGDTQAAKLLGGIPQSGNVLGNPDAPVTLHEFADLQCPFCRQYTEKTFPTIVAKYVRTGKVKMVFREYAFLGPDSVTAARAAEAAGQQNKLWNFIDVFYANQGTENSGYVTDKFLEKIANGAGADAKKLLEERQKPEIDQAIAQAQQDAQKYGINSTPSFLAQRKGGPLQKLSANPQDADAFGAALDKVIAAAGGK